MEKSRSVSAPQFDHTLNRQIEKAGFMAQGGILLIQRGEALGNLPAPKFHEVRSRVALGSKKYRSLQHDS